MSPPLWGPALTPDYTLAVLLPCGCHRGGEQCALSSDGLHPESWCCVCYFCTHSYVLQFSARPCQCCSASYRDCNNPRLIYLDKKSIALPHFAWTASSGVSIVAAVSLLTFHKSQVCREKELCFLHCNVFCSVLEQRSMGHMNYFQGWPRRVNVCEVEALIPKALSSVQMSSLVAPGMSAGQQDHNTLPAQLCQNTNFKFYGWTLSHQRQLLSFEK